jgi:hypothetical protein
MKCKKHGQYRWVVEVLIGEDEINLSDELLKSGHAVIANV